jgi:hypothetical protein
MSKRTLAAFEVTVAACVMFGTWMAIRQQEPIVIPQESTVSATVSKATHVEKKVDLATEAFPVIYAQTIKPDINPTVYRDSVSDKVEMRRVKRISRLQEPGEAMFSGRKGLPIITEGSNTD